MRDVWIRRFTVFLMGGFVGVKTPEAIRVYIFLALLLLGLRLGFWKARDFFAQVYKPEILLLTAGFLVGMLYGYTGNSALERPLLLDKVHVTGALKDWEVSAEGASGTIQLLSVDFEGNPAEFSRQKIYNLKVYSDREGKLPENWSRVLPGDELSFLAKLEHPKPPGTMGQFDLPLYYAVRGIAGNLTAQGDAELLSLGRPPYSWKLRERVKELLGRWPSEKTGILEGILFGDSSRIPQDDLERYKITGVLHVFSASGSNVAFLFAISWAVLQFLPQTLRVLLTGSILVFYALLCGGSPPIVRATIMGIFALIGRLGNGRVNSLRSLLLSGVFLFLWQPLILKDTGFQLSFLATWGIISLAPKLSGLNVFPRLPRGLRLALGTTLAAQLSTLPVLISSFHRLSLIGLLANLAVLVLLGSVFELGIIGVLLSFSATIALPLFQVSLWLLEAVNQALQLLARIPWADVWVLNPGILFAGIWYGGLAVVLAGQKRSAFVFEVGLRRLRNAFNRFELLIVLKQPKGGTALENISLENGNQGNVTLGTVMTTRASVLGTVSFLVGKGKCLLRKTSSWIGSKRRLALILLIILLLWSPWNKQGEVVVSFIDVGQGDSILVETPQHHAVLIDTGPKTERFDAGERIVLPYLLEKRIKHLDALILTHPHEDHVGGAEAILKNVPVDWVGVPDDGNSWDQEVQGNQALFTKDTNIRGKSSGQSSSEQASALATGLSQQLAQRKVMPLKSGDQVVLDSGVLLYVLGPNNRLTDTHSDANNNSVVLNLEYGGQSVLLSADMETEEMQDIVQSGQSFVTDYFKEPHHGSRFSLNMDFLDAIAPKVIFVSVGKNSFGHPDPKVLQYWKERHIPLYRTDERGTIELKLDEHGQSSVIMGR